MLISETEGYLENPYIVFLEESMLFLLVLNETSKKMRFPVLRQKPNAIFAIKLAEMSNLSFLQSFDEPFFKDLYIL